MYKFIEAMLISGFLLRFAWFYEDFSREQTRTSFEPRTSRGKNIPFVVSLVLIGILLVSTSILFSRSFNLVIPQAGNSEIVAHRTGGVLASENSVEGVEEAILYGCEGSETDIRRTKDGRYVVNHDSSFKRLTGVDKAPEEMTTEEISKLRIQDTTGSGDLLPVPMLEDLLDASTGRVRLYIELKGPTADQQMADDVVKLINEKYKVDDAALISLDYNVIQYAETHYPEYQTGVLMFQGFGDFKDMDCDIIMMEEDMLTDERIEDIHEAGKLVAAWTVNTEDGLRRVLSMGVDRVITDQVERAVDVMEAIENRTDLEKLEDYLHYHLGVD